MMRTAIFARTFKRATLDQVLDAIAASNIRDVHFNCSCAGLESLPAALDESVCRTVVESHRMRGLTMMGVSGTFNAIHPDAALRRQWTQRCVRLIQACARMNVPLVSLCTGTRCPTDMWAAHADNAAPQAWSDLCATLEPLIAAAETHRVTLGIEPERANVIDSAPRARRLLDEMRSPRLGVIMDGANLVDPHDPSAMQTTLRQAFDLLGANIVSVHAKELPARPSATPRGAGAGAGRLDWSLYFELLHRAGYTGPIVLHNLPEADVTASKAFIEAFMTPAKH